MRKFVLDGFGGPGGWDEALRVLGLPVVGLELDAAACATRAAAGHATVRVDVSRFPVKQLAGKVGGSCWSPPCTTFSGAGNRGGIGVMRILAETIRDQFAGRPTLARRRREMAHELRCSRWGGDTLADMKWDRKRQNAWKRKLLARRGSYAKLSRAMAAAAKVTGPHPTRAQRSAKIWDAVRLASLVAEPARFIHATAPEWAALEQVPEVLPLWRVYTAELAAMGYSTWTGVLNSADYGVPQTRERAILIASRVRTVSCPVPTHYDSRKGDQLWGTPWMSMAEALGWGATGRAAPTVTAGGTATGGAEPFGHRDRDALVAEREAGQWAPRKDAQAHAAVRPAPTMSLGHAPGAMRWVFRNNNNNNACTRSPDEPAGTLFFGGRSNWAAWVLERPATTVQGDPRVGRPGHKDRVRGGESQFAVDSVRITVEEAAALQSFRPDYPWQGSKTKQFQQVGNAIPPLLAQHVLAMAAGIQREEAAA